MSRQLPGQLALFGMSEELAQAVKDYGQACADLRWMQDQGIGRAVQRAEDEHRAALQRLRDLGFPVDDTW